VTIIGTCGDLVCALACDLLWAMAAVKQPAACWGRPYVTMRKYYKPLPINKKTKKAAEPGDEDAASNTDSDAEEDGESSTNLTHTQRMTLVRDVLDSCQYFTTNRRLWPIWESYIRMCAVPIDSYLHKGKQHPNNAFNEALLSACRKTPLSMYSRFVKSIVEHWQDSVSGTNKTPLRYLQC